jgi:hypothetical protein
MFECRALDFGTLFQVSDRVGPAGIADRLRC